MTARPPEPLHDDPLRAEERELAARLAKLDAAAGPSASLDARILGAARAAAPRPRGRRWPNAIGACAVLVAAVGLAWQLKPMFALGPAPIVGGAPGAATEVVVDVEAAPATPSPAAEAAQPAPAIATAPPTPQPPDATTPAATPMRKAAPRSAPRPPSASRADAASTARAYAGAAQARMLMERQAAPAAAAAPPPPPPPPPAPAASAEAAPVQRGLLDEPVAAQAADDRERITVTGTRIATAGLPGVDADTRLTMSAWLTRIRERRDGGDVAGARASLQRFRVAHPRVPVPDDLQRLLRDDGDAP